MASRAQYDPEAAPWSLEDELLKNFRLYVFRCCGCNQIWTSRLLGVSVRSLRYQLKEYREMGEEVGELEHSKQMLYYSAKMPLVSEAHADAIYEFVTMGGKSQRPKSAGFWRSWRKRYA